MSTTIMNVAKRVSKILIVDDHPIVRHGLAKLINDEPDLEVCGEADSAGDAMTTMESESPDLLLVDISLGGTNGIELIKRVKASDPEMRVLVSSMHDESLYAERALRAGAMGYLNKGENRETLLGAIRQVLRGKLYLSPRMSERLLHRFVLNDQEPDRPAIESLSDRELEVFQLIGEGLTTRQIASRLHLSPKTIETYREHIKAKLNLENSSELIRAAVQWCLEKH